MKFAVGIDISKDKFDVCISVINTEQSVTKVSSKCFLMTKKGFNELSIWIKKHTNKEKLPVVYLMEATGVYYEELAHYLYKKGEKVSVVLPNKSKSYFKSKGLKSKNDKIDAYGLSLMIAEQRLKYWQPMDKNISYLRTLTRRHEDLTKQTTSSKNKLHAYNHSYKPDKRVLKQYADEIKLIEKQKEEINLMITEVIYNSNFLKSKYLKASKIKGLSVLCWSTIIAETGGFYMITNMKQLTSYAGFDVVENNSGKHIGKTRISKKGNSHLRRIIYMPSLSIVKYEPHFKNLYERVTKKSGFKMKGLVAVQRKMLALVYVLWKKDEEYCRNYSVKIADNMNFETKNIVATIKVNETIKAEKKAKGIKKVVPAIITGTTLDKTLTKSKNLSFALKNLNKE